MCVAVPNRADAVKQNEEGKLENKHGLGIHRQEAVRICLNLSESHRLHALEA